MVIKISCFTALAEYLKKIMKKIRTHFAFYLLARQWKTLLNAGGNPIKDKLRLKFLTLHHLNYHSSNTAVRSKLNLDSRLI